MRERTNGTSPEPRLKNGLEEGPAVFGSSDEVQRKLRQCNLLNVASTVAH